jgi:hypothetical protein
MYAEATIALPDLSYLKKFVYVILFVMLAQLILKTVPVEFLVGSIGILAGATLGVLVGLALIAPRPAKTSKKQARKKVRS